MNLAEDEIRLTQFARGAGCGCKISSSTLDEILSGNQSSFSPNLLVGNHSKDDAAVFQYNENEAFISTTDFFTPIVDDAFLFGKVAAANAISDIYAMGGNPTMALAILGWPVEKLPVSLANTVMRGAQEICQIAGIPLAGGHSIDAAEPFFGLSVQGHIFISRLKRNDTIAADEFIFLTKPIGTGILATAEKKGLLRQEDVSFFHQTISTLNQIGSELSAFESVGAMTDITGFGLAGHLLEMIGEKELSAELNASQIPLFPNLEYYMNQFIVPDATYRNWKAYHNQIEINTLVNSTHMFHILPDPQTNGGILFTVKAEGLEEIQEFLQKKQLMEYVNPIGKIVAAKDKKIVINP